VGFDTTCSVNTTLQCFFAVVGFLPRICTLTVMLFALVVRHFGDRTSGRGRGVQTLRTRDTSDPRHFGTSAELSVRHIGTGAEDTSAPMVPKWGRSKKRRDRRRDT